MKKIPLTKGKFALVDDEDYDSIMQHKWYAYAGHCTFYAVRSRPMSQGRSLIRMHRQLLDLDDGQIADHRDCDGLNNQRCNLRKCTTYENQSNKGTPKNNTSGYKGVSWHKNDKLWQARISSNNNSIGLGSYFCIIKAAKAYDKAAIEHHGEFARVNFNQ